MNCNNHDELKQYNKVTNKLQKKSIKVYKISNCNKILIICFISFYLLVEQKFPIYIVIFIKVGGFKVVFFVVEIIVLLKLQRKL